MKLTKQELAVIEEMRLVQTKRTIFSPCAFSLLAITKQYRWIDLARWHLVKIKEARADGYMDAVLKRKKGAK